MARGMEANASVAGTVESDPHGAGPVVLENFAGERRKMPIPNPAGPTLNQVCRRNLFANHWKRWSF